VWTIEQELFQKGITAIAGVDEAGRGPLAGPVVAAAVIIPRGYCFREKIADSKKLTAVRRQKAYQEIINSCHYAYALVDEKEIDKDNILNAALIAMRDAVYRLPAQPQWVLIDGPHRPDISYSCTAVINGDEKSISIACASIIAKVTRDNLMLAYDKVYPQYGFARHKGYGTKSHCQAIFTHGPCPIHRKSFQPIKNFLKSRI